MFLQRVGGQHQHRHPRQLQNLFALAQQADGGDAVHDRHLHVHQHHVEVLHLQEVQRRLAVVDDGQMHPGRVHDQLHHPLVGGVVLGQQHPQARGVQGLVRLGHGAGRALLVRQRQVEDEARALPRARLRPDLTAHQLDQRAADGQAQAGAAEAAADRGVGLFEALEQPRLDLVVEADAGVADLEAQGSALQRPDPKLDLARLGELHRIAEQVGQDLGHPHAVAAIGPGGARVEAPAQRHAVGVGRGPVQLGHARDHRLQLERLGLQVHLARVDLGEVEDVGQHLLQQPAGGDDQLRQLDVARRGLFAGQGLGNGDHPVQRRAQLVAHIGQEAVLGGVGLGQVGGAVLHPSLQGGQQVVGALALGPERCGQHPDLVLAILELGRLLATDLAAISPARPGQAVQRIDDGAARQPDRPDRLGGREDQAQDQDPGGRARRRGGDGLSRIADQQEPVRPVQPAIGDDVAAVGAGDGAEGLVLRRDGGRHFLQPQLALVLIHRPLGRHAGLGEAGIGDQGAAAVDDQGLGLGQGVGDHRGQVAGQVHRRTERPDQPAVEIDRGGAGGGLAVAVLVLDQPLQVGASRAARGVQGRRHHPHQLLLGEAQAGLGVAAVEHQPVGPVGAEHHQLVAVGVEIEVVVVAARGLAEVGHHVEGVDQHAPVLGRAHRAGREEPAHAIDQPAVDALATVEHDVGGAAGAVGTQREHALEGGGNLVARALGIGGLQSAPQLVAGGALQGGQAGKPVIDVVGAFLHVLAEILDLTMLKLVFESMVGDERNHHRADERRQAQTNKKITRQRRIHFRSPRSRTVASSGIDY